MPRQHDARDATPTAPPEPDAYDWPALVDGLERYLRLKATPVGMKLFPTVEGMEKVERVRRPDVKLTLDQVVAQARWLRHTIGVTAEDFAAAQCGAVVGLHPQDRKWLSGKAMAGVWYDSETDAAAHQAALDTVPYGRYQALAVSPLASGRLDPPDVCLIYATPGQMIILINGLQFSGYRKFDFTCVGESACGDSWGRALTTGEPSVSIPCYAERSFGGVLDDELLMALPPRFLPKAIDGMAKLSANGLRYPIPSIGIQTDPTPILIRSYPEGF